MDRVIVNPTPEIVAKEVTAKEEEDHRIEAEEVQRAQHGEGASLRRWIVSAAGQRTIKDWIVLDSRTFVAPDVTVRRLLLPVTSDISETI